MGSGSKYYVQIKENIIKVISIGWIRNKNKYLKIGASYTTVVTLQCGRDDGKVDKYIQSPSHFYLFLKALIVVAIAPGQEKIVGGSCK